MKKKISSNYKHLFYSVLLFILVFGFLLGSCDKGSNPVEEEIPQSTDEMHTYSTHFNGGPSGYHLFRIPSIIRTTNGALIAFAECRRYSTSDFGDINLGINGRQTMGQHDRHLEKQ